MIIYVDNMNCFGDNIIYKEECKNGVDKLKRLSIVFIVLIQMFLLSGCIENEADLHIQKVGMILEGSIKDQPWDKKGYQGLMAIGEEYDVSVYYEENITDKQEVLETVKKFIDDGVNLIFGHSNIYGQYFIEIAKNYPDVHFVYFNGGYFANNVTSLNFNTHAMGFFAGLVAGRMTETNTVGIIAAYEWQQEIEGFYEGVKYQDPSTTVHINFMNNWSSKELAVEIYEDLKEKDVDIFYPVGDSFSMDIIKKANEDGLYSIGYLTSEVTAHEETVLTSTIQHVDKLYAYAAETFNAGELEGSLMMFDFQDQVITLGGFSQEVPEAFQKEVLKLINTYKETNLLPNEYY